MLGRRVRTSALKRFASVVSCACRLGSIADRKTPRACVSVSRGALQPLWRTNMYSDMPIRGTSGPQVLRLSHGTLCSSASLASSAHAFSARRSLAAPRCRPRITNHESQSTAFLIATQSETGCLLSNRKHSSAALSNRYTRRPVQGPFLPVTQCRVETRVTRRKQTMAARSTRHSHEGAAQVPRSPIFSAAEEPR
jgi:hypothetical protein